MRNQNSINLTSKDMGSKKFIKSSQQKGKARIARDIRWNKNSEYMPDDFEPYDEEEELDIFRKIKPRRDRPYPGYF